MTIIPSESRDLIANMTQSGSFDLARTYGSVQELSAAMARGELDAGMAIPNHFDKDLQRGHPTDVQILLNAMNANTAAIGQGYAEGVIQSWNQSLAHGGLHAKFQNIATNAGTLRGTGDHASRVPVQPGAHHQLVHRNRNLRHSADAQRLGDLVRVDD